MSSRPVRFLVAGCLLLAGLLSFVSVLLQPTFSQEPTARLAELDAAGASAVVSALTFGLAQLPFLVAVVAVAALTHRGAPRAAWVAGVLAVLGGFGHAVFSGVSYAYLALAADSSHRATLGQVVTRVEAGPAKVFMAMGLLGTVLGLVTLGIALFRSRVAPRWIPVALWAFVVVEFAFSGLSDWAEAGAGALFLAAFTGMAAQVWRGPVPAVAPGEAVTPDLTARP